MRKNINHKMFILNFVILLAIFSITTGYSVFLSELSISKIVADVRVEKDVRITDVSLVSESSNDVLFNDLDYDFDSILGNVTFNSTSSYITYKVTISNIGNAEVGIYNINVPEGIGYEVSNYKLNDKICDNSGSCSLGISKDINIKIYPVSDVGVGLENIKIDFDFRSYHKVTYTDINVDSTYPTEVIDGGDLSITFKENLKRVSILSNDVEISFYNQISSGQTIKIEKVSNDIEIKKKEPVARLVNGSIDEVGSEVCIKDECFYIISNDGSTVSMLAKYNLYVGGEYNSEWTAYVDEATGKQDSMMVGLGTKPYKGVSQFSDTNYWSGTLHIYPSYIYDSNSLLYSYVENYKIYLNTLGVTPSGARLITYEELKSLGCSGSSCKSAPSWVYATSYWTGTANSTNNVWIVYSDRDFSTSGYANSKYFGCRPVIEISVEEIYVPPVASVVSGDLDTVGSEVCIKEECFYVISSDEDSVTMLAKYNLHVGNIATVGVSGVNYNVDDYKVNPLVMTPNNAYMMPLIDDAPDGPSLGGEEDTIETIPIENPSGIQDASAKGIVGDSSYIGVVNFSSNNYWTFCLTGGGGWVLYEKYGTEYPAYVYDSNSSLYSYVEDYKVFLQNYGVVISSARLISREELDRLGCDNGSCMSAPSWVYSTSYWTGSATGISTVVGVKYVGDTLTTPRNINYYYGVRPVITIPKSEF